MNGLFSALALTIELFIAILFAFLIFYGDVLSAWQDLAILFVIILLGSLLITAKLQARKIFKFCVHLALIEGSVLFAFPFIWLLSTSMKYDEELFVYPPRWLPTIPSNVIDSPYSTNESIRRADRPTQFSKEQWLKFQKRASESLFNIAKPNLPTNWEDTPPLNKSLGNALFHVAARSIPPNEWDINNENLETALIKHVNLSAIRDAIATIYRGVAFRAPLILKTNQQVFPTQPSSNTWNTEGSENWLRPPDENDARILQYSFSNSKIAKIIGRFHVDIENENLLGFTLPIRGDRSWHSINIATEWAGIRYETEDPLYLGKHRWQELSFKIADRDDRDERELGIWPLVKSDNQQDVNSNENQLVIDIKIEYASHISAIFRKYIDSYYNAYIATEHRWSYVYNSIFLTIMSIIGQVLSCSLAAYAFARLHWPGRDMIFGLLLATMMLPGQVTMIPVFMIFRILGWYNTLEALWVPSFFGSAFFIFMLRQFMRAIPTDLEDAAKIDGCGFLGIYWRIILPLTRPAIAAICVFTFMNTWNDFMGPLIYINDQRLYPLALGLFDFRSEHGSEFGMLMAASALMAIPVIVIFFAAQRYFIQGVTLTGMKS